jgi:predicted RNA-binding Zn-ribbon protein involved in translation (DUF1610 family)
MTQQSLQLAFSVQGRQTAVGQKVSKKPVKFSHQCPKCDSINGQVVRNQDFILWFDCPECGYSASWKEVSAKIREVKAKALD